MKNVIVCATIASALSLPIAANADVKEVEGHGEHAPIDVVLQMPQMNSENGRELFVSKGCVTCHAVNGVGGEDASPLDAVDMEPVMNPFELAAKMWRMAPFMIEAQEEELGEQIQFTGDELADIIAFLHDDKEQHELTMESLPEEIRAMLDH